MDYMICAACGKGGDDLKTCTACKAVKYCSVTCQKDHRRNHKKECKKGAAELFDEALFKQPPPREDCPICFLPMPRMSQTMYMPCCGKTICLGCDDATVATSNGNNCPFCRKQVPTIEEEVIERFHARIATNDADALHHLASHYFNGALGLPQDLEKAMELLFQGAELGSKAAHDTLARCYHNGQGVKKDKKKAKYHWEIAAMAGDEEARHNLGSVEQGDGNIGRAIKHWMIAAKAGHDGSMENIKRGLERGLVIKDDYEKTLRAYIVSIKELRSENRDKAAAAHN